jgi:hypothetical protein
MMLHDFLFRPRRLDALQSLRADAGYFLKPR